MPWGFVQTCLRCRFALFVIRRVTFFQNSTHLFLIQPVSRTFLEYFSKKRTIIVYYFPFPFLTVFPQQKSCPSYVTAQRTAFVDSQFNFSITPLKSCCRSVHSVFPGSGRSDALYSRLARLLPTIRPKMKVMI